MHYGGINHYVITKVKSLDNEIQAALSNPLNQNLWVVDNINIPGQHYVDCENKNRPEIIFSNAEKLSNTVTYKLTDPYLTDLIEASGLKNKRQREPSSSGQHGGTSRQRTF